MAPSEHNRGTVCLVEDDGLVRKGLTFLLEQQGFSVEEFETGVQLLERVTSLSCACVLLDINLPDMNGLDILSTLGSRRPDIKVIIITGQGNVPTAVKAMQLGAIDFIEKPPTADRLRDAMERAISANGQETQIQSGEPGALRPPLNELSKRELEVLTLLVNGHQHKVIAHKLGISHRTVEVHKSRIMRRFGARSFAELVRIAVLSGIDVD